jgi:hypothetical protein
MRSAAALFSHRRRNGVSRVRIAARAKPRTLSLHLARDVRRTAGRARGPARSLSATAAARTPLARVRPLRIVPRGVIPYVKH